MREDAWLTEILELTKDSELSIDEEESDKLRDETRFVEI